MLDEMLRMIRRLFGSQRTPFHQLVEIATAECSGLSDMEILSAAEKAREAGDCARAAVLLNVVAARDNAEAQFKLGQMFVEGDVPTERFPQGELSYRMQRIGVRWLMAAAKAGHSGAETRLGSIWLVDGNTTEVDRAPPHRELKDGQR